MEDYIPPFSRYRRFEPFTHSGMTGLLDCVNENSDVTIVISDNETTAMTGGQDSAGTGRIEAICTGLGVDPAHIPW